MQTRFKAAPSLAVATFLVLVALTPQARAATLAEALETYRNNHVADAERQLGEVAADPNATPADRAGALRELGRIDGLMRGETDAIATAMAQTPNGEEACSTAVVALRVYREANQPVQALAYAEAAAPHCTTGAADALRIETARSQMALAVSDGAQRAQHLRAAATALDGIAPVAKGSPDVAGARFSLAMLRRDARGAFNAWRDYYWLTDTDAPQALNTYSGRVQSIFSAGLAASASDADALALAALLTRAGFTADARQYATDLNLAQRNSDNADWRRIDSFFTFDAAVRTITLRINREIANGGTGATYGDEIRAAMGQLLASNNLSAGEDPIPVLAENFGIYGTVGETSGYPSLHGGHLAQRERLAVSQYGRSGEVEFIVIDHMLANGYESWLWDGWAQAGGWSSNGNTIVQVRSAYTSSPLGALRRTRPGPSHERFQQMLQRAEVDERAALGRDGVVQLPATADRLEQQVYDQLATRFSNDEDFIAEVWRATNQYSITSHEGRHALDNTNQPGLADAQLEFRAKLSQIIFADYPRLGLANVAAGAINDTAHGVGNRRVLEGYRRWMRAHRSEIAGFDRSAPTLSQLDKLTGTQIVTAARSMDPWAN